MTDTLMDWVGVCGDVGSECFIRGKRGEAAEKNREI